MPKESPTPKSNCVKHLVRIVSGYIRGAGCRCSAYGESECACFGVDWRSKREFATATALNYCLETLKKGPTTNTDIQETIRNTEAILEAGNYRPN